MFSPGNASRTFGIGLAVVAAGLFIGTSSASAKVVKLRSIRAKVHIPRGWKKSKVKPGKSVSFAMRNGGKFSVSWKQRKLPLGLVAAALKKRGRKLGWRLLKEKRAIRHRGKRAHLVVFEVPTNRRRIKVRAAFYFVNTRNGYYTLYFGTKRKHFRNGLYKSVYRTFRTL